MLNEAKTWRDWSFALKLQSLNSSWLCCAPQGLIEIPVFGGQSLHQSNDSFLLLPSCRASWCLDRFQVTSDPLSDDLGAQPTANRTGWVSTEDMQRPNQSNCLRDACHAKRSNATCATSKSDPFCRTYHRQRTVADGGAHKRNVERTHPQPPDPQSETGTLATHSGKDLEKTKQSKNNSQRLLSGTAQHSHRLPCTSVQSCPILFKSALFFRQK